MAPVSGEEGLLEQTMVLAECQGVCERCGEVVVDLRSRWKGGLFGDHLWLQKTRTLFPADESSTS